MARERVGILKSGAEQQRQLSANITSCIIRKFRHLRRRYKHDCGLFHRSILWQHGEEVELEDGLERIEFPIEITYQIPSWSWMAYKGGIDYINIPFGAVDWDTKDILEPWTHGFGPTADSALQDGVTAIPAIVRDFAVANRRPDEVNLVYDTGITRGSDGQRAQCVIVAKDKRGRSEELKRHYVLLVARKQAISGRGRTVYKRLGAGYMLGKYISLHVAGIEAEIH